MLLKKYGNMAIFKKIVGREKKEQAAFPPLVLLSGTEEVGKTGAGRLTDWTGTACPKRKREDWSG